MNNKKFEFKFMYVPDREYSRGRKDLIDYLKIKILWFRFYWFNDYGTRFMNITWETKKWIKGIKFSRDAGTMMINHYKND